VDFVVGEWISLFR